MLTAPFILSIDINQPPAPTFIEPPTPTNLAALVSTTQAHAYAPGTLRNLHSLWKSFLNFCTNYRVTPLPATPHTVASYACFLAGKTSSYQYILNHLHAVRLLHRFNGFPVHALDSFDVTLTKRGLKRLLGTMPRQKHPITPEILLQMRRYLNTSLPSHAAIWALFCTAFFSFLRKSNLTVTSAQCFDPTRHLARHVIKFTTTGAVLRIRWTKTLQHKEGLLLIPLPSIPGSALCPVSAKVHFFALVPAPTSAPLFCLSAASSYRPITFSTFTAGLKRLISKIGLDPANYSPHSFRGGGATFAFQSGVPEHLIRLHGDWRCDAFRAYLALPLTSRTQVADIMAAGLLPSKQ